MFADRIDAGRRLADHLVRLRARGEFDVGPDTVVVGLPRGGVPVAHEVARALDAPLDVIIVRKLGAPHRPELGFGAIGENDIRVIDEEIVRLADVSASEMTRVEARERTELTRRAERFRRGRARIRLAGRQVIIVDDGVATGSTARAACLVARSEGGHPVVLAVPVAPEGWERHMGDVADRYICLETPEEFFGVGGSYHDFRQTSDDEVTACLDAASSLRGQS